MPAQKNNQYAKGNRGGGRNSEYKPTFANTATKLALLGATDKDLADFFDVSEQTINTWKKKHEEFSLALKKGKIMADAEVATKLFKRATGYSHEAVKIINQNGRTLTVPYTEHYPPDTIAAIFWLKNRQKEQWREKQDFSIDFDKLTDEQLDLLIERIAGGKH